MKRALTAVRALVGLPGAAAVLLAVTAGCATTPPPPTAPSATAPNARPVAATVAPVAAELAEGRRLTDLKDYRAAEEQFTRILAQEPQSAQAYLGRGIARSKRGAVDAAIADFAKSVELDPTLGVAQQYIGLLQEQRRDFAAAESAFTRALERWPASVDLLACRARVRQARGDLQGALADLGRALALDQTAALYYQRASVRWDLSDYEGSLADANEIVRRAPMDASGYTSRGMARLGLNHFDGALGDLDRALIFAPDQPEILALRGLAQLERGEFDLALVDAEQSLKLRPTATAYSVRSGTMRKRLRYREAVADLDEAVKLEPANPRWYHNRSEARRYAGDLEGAVEDAARVIELRPAAPMGYFARGVVYQEQDKDAEAIEDFNRVLEMNQRYAAAFNRRSESRLKTGDFTGALADAESLLRLHDGAPSWFARAQARVKLRDFDGALADYNEAIRRMPDLANAFMERAEIFDQKLDFAAAVRELDQAIAARPDEPYYYMKRSAMKDRLGDLEGAMADSTRDLELSRPPTASNYSVRAWLRLRTHDWTGAAVDIAQALALAPDSENALKWRAVLAQANGDFAAAADYTTLHQRAPEDRYIALWLGLARARAGEKHALEALGQSADTWQSGWPRTIAHFLAGRISPVVFEAAARSADGVEDGDQRCEYHFYSGMLSLIGEDPSAAKKSWERCVAADRPRFYETLLAEIELRRRSN